jgi:hypothetical protein
MNSLFLFSTRNTTFFRTFFEGFGFDLAGGLHDKNI